MGLERALVLTLFEVPQADARVFTRCRYQIVERMYRNFGYFSAMALHRIFCGLSWQSVINASLASKGRELRHAVASFTRLVRYELLCLRL